jgi:hypothetical protein
LVFLIAASGIAAADSGVAAGSPTAAARIVQEVDENNVVQIKGSTHPLARAEFDQGVAADSLPMEHMLLQLQRGAAEEAALEEFINSVQDPHSTNYHNWLSAEEFGTKFGPSQADIQTVTAWLQAYGFQVTQVYASGMVIDFSGTAGLVRSAFHTEMHNYTVKSVNHVANASDVEIPGALASGGREITE